MELSEINIAYITFGQNLLRGGIKLYLDIANKIYERNGSYIKNIYIVNVGSCNDSINIIRNINLFNVNTLNKISVICLDAISTRMGKDQLVFGITETINSKKLHYLLLNLINKNKVNSRIQFLDKIIQKSQIIHVSPWYLAYVPYIIERAVRMDSKIFLFPLYHPFLFQTTNRFLLNLSYYLNYFKVTSAQGYLTKFSGITVSTPFEYKIFKRFSHNVYHVGEGVDLKKIGRFKKDNKTTVKTLGRGLKILYIGARSKGKMYDFLLRSILRFYRKFKVKTYLIVAGPKNETSNQAILKIESLESILKKYGILIDYGIISEEEKFNLIQQSDISIMPSLYETIPLFFLESWAMSTPVIGPNTPSISSIITYQGDGGFVYNFLKQNSLSNLLYKIYINRIDLKKIGEEGYKKVLSHYNLDSVTDRLLQIYKI